MPRIIQSAALPLYTNLNGEKIDQTLHAVTVLDFITTHRRIMNL
jgi:hypothetical protein